MAQHKIRLDAPGQPELGQGILQRKERGLGVGGVGKQRGGLCCVRLVGRPACLVGRIEQFDQGATKQGLQDRIALLQRVLKNWLGCVEVVPHCQQLRALARKEKGKTWLLGSSGASHHRWCGLTPSEGR